MTFQDPGYCTKGHAILGENAQPATKTRRGRTYHYLRCRLCANAKSRVLMREKYAERGTLRSFDDVLCAIRDCLESPAEMPQTLLIMEQFFEGLRHLQAEMGIDLELGPARRLGKKR